MAEHMQMDIRLGSLYDWSLAKYPSKMASATQPQKKTKSWERTRKELIYA